MASHAIAQMFHASDPKEAEESPAEEAGETPAEESAEGGMSDAEAQHHAKVQMHLGKAMAAHARGKHKEAKVHTKLAMHHHAAAMVEAGHDLTDQEHPESDTGENDEMSHASGGSPQIEPGQPA